MISVLTIPSLDKISSLFGSLGCGKDDQTTRISLLGNDRAKILYIKRNDKRASLVGGRFFLAYRSTLLGFDSAVS